MPAQILISGQRIGRITHFEGTPPPAPAGYRFSSSTGPEGNAPFADSDCVVCVDIATYGDRFSVYGDARDSDRQAREIQTVRRLMADYWTSLDR